MVNYKVRVFCEPEDDDSLGAEVRIYGEDGDVIDTILITTESQYQQLASQIQNIDDTYIDLEELTTLLSNTENNTLNINAAMLGGVSANDYARLNHNELHVGTFAPVGHASETTTYGLADSTKYGHVKTVNNLTTNSNLSGEALSAYQGKVLKDAIDEAVRNISKWEKVTLTGHNKVEDYANLWVNRALKIARLTYRRDGVKKGVGSSKSGSADTNPSPYWIPGVQTSGYIILHGEGAIPEDYAPTTRIIQPFYRGDFVFRIESNGSLTVHNSSGGGSKTNGVNIYQNILWHYSG